MTKEIKLSAKEIETLKEMIREEVNSCRIDANYDQITFLKDKFNIEDYNNRNIDILETIFKKLQRLGDRNERISEDVVIIWNNYLFS